MRESKDHIYVCEIRTQQTCFIQIRLYFLLEKIDTSHNMICNL